MRKRFGFLGLLASLFIIFFSGDLFAAGYTCTKKYTSCSAGYYMTSSDGTTYNGTPTVGNKCTICPKGKYCEGGTKNATNCPAGMYRNDTGGTSESSCTACSGSLEYQDEAGKTSCKSVSTGYYKESNSSQSQCPAGYREIAATSKNACQGTFEKSGSQQNGPIPENCSSVLTWNDCSPGTCDYIKNYEGTILQDCTPTNCEKKPKTVSAKSGYYVSGVTCPACSSFADGFYPNSNNENTGGKTACRTVSLSGQYVTKNATAATDCTAGTFKGAHTVNYGSSSSCSVCETNKYSDKGAASCLSCDTTHGYGNSGTTAASHAGVASCKVTCDAGEYVKTASGGCVSVGSGYYTSSSVTVAQNATSSRNACSSLTGVSVSGGTYSSVSPYNASTTCRYKAPNKTITGCDTVTTNTVSYNGSAWPATTYSVSADAKYYISGNNTASATCKACASGTYSAGGTVTTCRACSNKPSNSSYTGNASSNACPWSCSAGYYGSSANGNTSCSACGTGYYCTGGTSKTACTSVYANTTTTTTTATSSSSCVCKAGYGGTSASACTACAKGTYKSSAGTVACTSAGSGYYTDTTGATSRKACSSLTGVSVSGGTYSSVSPYNASTTCRYKGPAKKITGCDTVTTNTVSYNGSAWPATTYSVSADAKYYISGNNTASATCKACASGTYSAGGTVTTCRACSNKPSNSSYTGNASSNACPWSCSAGYYGSSANGNTSCSACGTGYYCTGGTSKTACTSVYSNTTTTTTTATSSSSCVCKAGYGGTSSSSCTACTKGTYKPNAGNSVCSSVGSGYYTDTTAATSRKACSSLTGVSVSGGTYSSVSPYNASTTCRYKAPNKTITGCDTVTTNTVSYSGTAWPATTYKITADPGYYISNNNTASAKCTQCSGAVYSGGGTATSCSSCPAQTSGWTRATGTGWTSYSNCYQTKPATSVSTYCSSGQLKQVAASRTTWNTSTVSTTFNAKPGAYVTGTGANTTCSQCTSNYYCPGGTTTRQACSALANGFYPNSPAGSDAAEDCYTSTLSGKYVKSPKDSSATNCTAGTFKGAHTVNYGSSSSCSVCETNKYSDAVAASCLSCDTTHGYGNSGTTAASHAGVASCKVTCDAGEYVPTASGGCVSVGSGYYTSSSVTVAQNATSSRNACSSLTGVSVSGGTYSSVSPYNASTTCRYKAPNKTITGCDTVTTNTVSYSGTAWPATPYTVSAKPGYMIANNNTATATCSLCTANYYCPGGTTARQACSALSNGFYPNSPAGSDAAEDCYTNALIGSYVETKKDNHATTCKNWTWKGSHNVNYNSTSVCSSCPPLTSGWVKGSGTGWTAISSCYQTRNATVISQFCEAGQLKQTGKSLTEWNPAEVSITFEAILGSIVTGSAGTSSCQACPDKTYSNGGTNRTCEPCPVGSFCDSGIIATCPDGGTSEPESDDITQCYKENLLYVASKGQGTKTCYYNPTTKQYDANCKDFLILYCDAGYYLETPFDIDCGVVERNYYSPDKDTKRYDCPDGGLTDIETAYEVYQCYKNNVDYYSDHGQGKQSCFYLSGSGIDAIYDRDCSFHTMLYCDGGYYYDETILKGECLEAGYGYYSKDKLLYREKCPLNGLTLTPTSQIAAECFLEHLYCPIVYGQGEQICNYDESRDSYTLNCQTCYVTSCDETYSQVGNTCIMCPINNVCFDLKQETCESLTSGTHPFSDEGTTSVSYCYDTCDIAENATSMQGRDYFGIADTCEITQCNAKYYLNKGVCDICPEGNYCDGSLPTADIKSCADLGNGSWKYSAEGSDKSTQCYQVCETHKIEGGTAYPYNKTEFWPTNCSFYGISDSGNACDIIDGKCIEKGCKYDQEKVDGVCVPCDRDHALTYQPGGNCLVATCENGWHPNGKQCESDIKACSAPDAVYAERVWDSKSGAFSPCMIKECEPDFHIASNACVPNVQVCSVENGTGMKEWNEKTSTWGDCQPTSCEPGYTMERMDTDEPNKPCGRCKNRFSTLGEIAVSSYVRECEIAACLYQGELYNLENNECVPICETRSDETGTQYWDSSRKKCVRTCSDGYTMW